LTSFSLLSCTTLASSIPSMNLAKNSPERTPFPLLRLQS